MAILNRIPAFRISKRADCFPDERENTVREIALIRYIAELVLFRVSRFARIFKQSDPRPLRDFIAVGVPSSPMSRYSPSAHQSSRAMAGIFNRSSSLPARPQVCAHLARHISTSHHPFLLITLIPKPNLQFPTQPTLNIWVSWPSWHIILQKTFFKLLIAE